MCAILDEALDRPVPMPFSATPTHTKVPTSIDRTSAVRHSYGADPSQFAELHLPTGERRRGTVVLLHGGWWGPQYGADNLDAVAADLAERGWVAWNVEYRRLELGGGYPATLEDVAAAIDHLATIDDVAVDRVVAIGHSAGGHLAAWAAGRGKLRLTLQDPYRLWPPR